MELFLSLFELLGSLFKLLVALLSQPIVLLAVMSFLVFLIIKIVLYMQTSYYKITKLPYFSLRRNLGCYGEYLTYMQLRKLERTGTKFLFNVYIPKENDKTTEIDVLMIAPKGIFVFESKNYSGWIFGNELQKNWYQTLPRGKGRSHKEHFYNPIMQNNAHIRHLKALIGDSVPTWSVIVFSNRCTLKNVQVKSNEITVINRRAVAPVVNSIFEHTPADLLTPAQISEIYDQLFPYTQVDKSVKDKHIANIRRKTHSTSLKPETSLQLSDQPTMPVTSTDKAVVPNSLIVESSPEEVIARKDMGTDNANAPASHVQVVNKCPRCGSNLILRTASKGSNIGNQFWGCSNYPKCRYIQKQTERS